ncbi:MAG: hypothetical protein GX682_05680 [Clostridiaceae bacterium]|nr:hypothetical protein [Clostridiaceae bacterium]
MHTWSEEPKKNIYQHLDMLTYPKNCEKLLSGKINSKRTIIPQKNLKKKSKEISFCLKQGIEFFKNAEYADISIVPLLLYYGMLSFSKALIISNSTEEIYLDDIKYHGLTTRTKNEKQKIQKNNKKNWSLLNEYANVNDGVFLELSKLFSQEFNKNIIIKLKDTLSSVPELKTLIDKLNIFESNSINCYSEINYKNDAVDFGIYTYDITKLEKKCPKIKKDFIKSKMHGSNAFTQYSSNINISPDNFTYFYNYSSVIGGRYFVFPINVIEGTKKKSILINQILIDYVNFFILSEQVRYHQDNWNKILSGENDALISIIKIYVECVKRRFPNLILNYLFNESFSYGSPAYLN